MADRLLPPIEFLRECFLYDPETGSFRWRVRPGTHFPDDNTTLSWNLQYAGKPVFATVDKGGYCRAEVRREGRRYRLTAGRVAFALIHGWCPHIVDHEDGDPTNNRERNLRPATDEQSQWNKHSVRRPGIPRGAFLDKGRWTARVIHNRRRIYLGSFGTALEAHHAYCTFVRRERGEFANTGPNYYGAFG